MIGGSGFLTLASLADIGANLTDGMFQGQYMGKAYHNPDLTRVLDRAWTAGAEADTICAEVCAYTFHIHVAKT